MSSLKEIKSRIQSVRSTRKITSAMKMISSVKLQKAEKNIQHLLPYENRLGQIMKDLLSNLEGKLSSGYAEEREVKRVALVVFSSNSSLCGGFNANVIKKMNVFIQEHKHLGHKNVEIYAVGKKAKDGANKAGFVPFHSYENLADTPDLNNMSEVTDKLLEKFLNKEIDKIEIIYHHFKSKGSQVLTHETLLPVKLNHSEDKLKKTDFLVEPDSNTLINELIPHVLRTTMYRALLDSNASEHAARMLAMQSATDNASDLINELTLQYNKTRQQAITAELLDIIGGTMR